MRSPHVVVGYHHWGLVNGKFCYALARAISYEGNRIKSVVEIGSPYTDEARNKIVETFLGLPPVEYLLMVDADIEFEKDAISKTMWVAQNFDADVVWGNYSLGTFSNSIFSKDDKTDLSIPMSELKPNMIYHGVYNGGTGWCLMNRRILLKMQKECPGPWHWFDRDVTKDAEGKEIKLGEDFTFGKRVWYLGGKQLGYTGVMLIHHKNHATAPEFMQEVLADGGRDMVKLSSEDGVLTGSDVRKDE